MWSNDRFSSISTTMWSILRRFASESSAGAATSFVRAGARRLAERFAVERGLAFGFLVELGDMAGHLRG